VTDSFSILSKHTNTKNMMYSFNQELLWAYAA